MLPRRHRRGIAPQPDAAQLRLPFGAGVAAAHCRCEIGVVALEMPGQPAAQLRQSHVATRDENATHQAAERVGLDDFHAYLPLVQLFEQRATRDIGERLPLLGRVDARHPHALHAVIGDNDE